MELFQRNHLTTPSNSVWSNSTRGCCETGMRVSFLASTSLAFVTDSIRNKKEIISLPHDLLHFTTLPLKIYGFSYSRCIYSHVQTSPRLWGMAPVSLMEVVLPRNSFWVLMSLKSRGQILGSTVPLSAAAWRCKEAVKLIQEASWTFSLAQREASSRPGYFHWKNEPHFVQEMNVL